MKLKDKPYASDTSWYNKTASLSLGGFGRSYMGLCTFEVAGRRPGSCISQGFPLSIPAARGWGYVYHHGNLSLVQHNYIIIPPIYVVRSLEGTVFHLNHRCY